MNRQAIPIELERLGRLTPEQIRDEFVAAGCTGNRGDGATCPTARHLEKIADPDEDEMIVVGPAVVYATHLPSRFAEYTSPDSLRQFVLRFDRGMYPALEDRT